MKWNNNLDLIFFHNGITNKVFAGYNVGLALASKRTIDAHKLLVSDSNDAQESGKVEKKTGCSWRAGK